MELETAHLTIRSPSSQAPNFRDDQENDKHFRVRFFRQAIWFLSGKKDPGAPSRLPRSVLLTRYGERIGHYWEETLPMPYSISDAHHGSTSGKSPLLIAFSIFLC
jgi:hypothetical protein